MKELNELVELANKADKLCLLMRNVNPHTILTIAEAFRALEQEKDKAEVEKAGAEERIRMMFDAKNHWADRARAAEAKLETKEHELTQYVECFEAEAARADRNHAKLAELENQDPVVWVTMQKGFCDDERTAITDKLRADEYSMNCYDLTPLYIRPAPAINLAELVPDERTAEYYYENYPQMAFSDVTTRAAEWNACRAAILRNIEAAK